MGKGSKRRPGKGYEDNYERIFKKMNIYLVERPEGGYSGEYESWVVICKDEEEAAQSSPIGCPYKDIRVTLLGTAAPNQTEGIVHESYIEG